MKTPILVGVLLLLLGAGAFAYQGVSHKPAGPEHTLPLSPMLGAVALVAGTVLVIIGRRKPPVY